VRIGTLASAEAPAAKRKKERREIPEETAGSSVGNIGKTPLRGMACDHKRAVRDQEEAEIIGDRGRGNDNP
jgi:hypothetical protein